MLVEKNFVPGNGWKKVSFGTMKNIRIISVVNFEILHFFMTKSLISYWVSSVIDYRPNL